MPKPKFAPEKVARAIRDANGLLSFAAQALGLSRRSVLNYVDRYACCKEAVDEAREAFVDVGESKFMKAIAREEPWAIAMQLKTIGKHRGYIERQQIEQSGTVKSEVIVHAYFPDREDGIEEPQKT